VLENEEFLVLAATDPNYYVQFAGHGTAGMRAEAASNTYLTEPARLSEDACQALQALGWRRPTYVPVEGAPPPATGSPNFFIDATGRVPYAHLAALAVRTLRTVYRIRRPADLRPNPGRCHFRHVVTGSALRPNRNRVATTPGPWRTVLRHLAR
jgi:hypothetical protein